MRRPYRVPIPFRHNFGVIVCGYISDYHHLSAPVIRIATRGTIAQKAGWCKKEKDTDNLFDYQCLSSCFGEPFPLWKWSWRESNHSHYCTDSLVVFEKLILGRYQILISCTILILQTPSSYVSPCSPLSLRFWTLSEVY